MSTNAKYVEDIFCICGHAVYAPPSTNGWILLGINVRNGQYFEFNTDVCARCDLAICEQGGGVSSKRTKLDKGESKNSVFWSDVFDG